MGGTPTGLHGLSPERVDFLTGAVHLDGGTGANRLIVNDGGDDDANTGSLEGSSIAGLDIPEANTMIVHRADRFGLSQLYQIRGRIGRSKTRAYAYLTLPPGQELTPAAQKRLLQIAAVIGHDVPGRVLRAVAGESETEMWQALETEHLVPLEGGHRRI